VRIDLAPASERRIGKCPDQEWTNGCGDLVVFLKRQVQRDSADMVPVIEEPPARVDHVHDRPHPPASVGKARVLEEGIMKAIIAGALMALSATTAGTAEEKDYTSANVMLPYC
jgi:hypothetical protein